jgi:hypothetical protein
VEEVSSDVRIGSTYKVVGSSHDNHNKASFSMTELVTESFKGQKSIMNYGMMNS